MSRIIVDAWTKEGIPSVSEIDDPNWIAFQRRAHATNEMFGWLQQRGILKDVAFEYRDYDKATWFALDADELKSYRDEMLQSGVDDAALATDYIFDQTISPCMYSGVIQLTAPMQTYRDNYGTVGRSWECTMVQSMHMDKVGDVMEVRDKAGVREAATKMFDSMAWNPGVKDKKSVTEQRAAEAAAAKKSEQYRGIRKRIGKNAGLNQLDDSGHQNDQQYE